MRLCRHLDCIIISGKIGDVHDAMKSGARAGTEYHVQDNVDCMDARFVGRLEGSIFHCRIIAEYDSHSLIGVRLRNWFLPVYDQLTSPFKLPTELTNVTTAMLGLLRL